MAADFPNTPVIGQVVNINGISRRWDGTSWKVLPTTSTGPTGAAATINVGAVTTSSPGSDVTVTNSGTVSQAVFDFSIPRGADGQAATIAVGTVTTGAEGSNATVTNVGTTSAATFNFSIPRGNTGPQGPEGIAPVASIVMTAAASAPSGWLLCQGQAVSRTTYSSLFTAIGTLYGAGNGSTTFNLPNLQGRIPVGLDTSQTEFNALGTTGGAKTHTLTVGEMPSHTHTQDAHSHNITDPTHNHSQNSHNHSQNSHLHSIPNVVNPASGTSRYFESWSGGTDTSRTHNTDSTTATNNATTATNNASSTGITINSATAVNQNTGGGLAHNNLQPYVVVNYIIKT